MDRPDPPLPEAFCRWLAPALAVFSPTCRPQAAALAVGALLALGPRTVAGALRALGLAGRADFATFHRVLSRDVWSGLALARRLTRALVRVFAPLGPVVVGLDHTLERRRGPRVRPAAHYYDPVRSSRGRKVTSRGLRWVSAMLLAEVPFARKVWALPMLSALAPSQAFCQAEGRRYRPVTAWALSLLRLVRRWLPGRAMVAVMDGEFASVGLLRELGRAMTVVTRLRLDARLFDFPAPRPPGRGGRPATKGKAQTKLAKRRHDAGEPWQRFALLVRTGRRHAREAEFISGTALWHHPGEPPVAVRWILVRYPGSKRDPDALACTDLTADPLVILGWFSRRWLMELTYEEARAHLGVETQRQHADKAVFRTTPVLFGLYSLVALHVQAFAGQLDLTPRRAAWYPKTAPTFADALAAVRIALWTDLNFVTALDPGETVQIL
ncbi:transposase (plasmid) [Skermanella mucosa]|uniref:IS701 family transposase n=1 Tax=Skermanella mucosa TaxID=1789672 RepID=UPI001E2C39BB|nr:transposase [Skermanella mucosa]UEM24393.1 transposase [Skermanella mucosa]